MAVYTPYAKTLSTTGASGNTGVTAVLAQHNTTLTAAYAAITTVTGLVPQSVSFSPAALSVDTLANIYTVVSTMFYQTSI